MSRVLLIEDDYGARTTLTQMLTMEGHEVITAPNGAHALRHIKESAPDLVITDIFMPEKDGIETILELRKKGPQVPVIAISGGGELEPSDYLDTARRLGARAALRKPFSHEEFLQAVRNALLEQ